MNLRIRFFLTAALIPAASASVMAPQQLLRAQTPATAPAAVVDASPADTSAKASDAPQKVEALAEPAGKPLPIPPAQRILSKFSKKAAQSNSQNSAAGMQPQTPFGTAPKQGVAETSPGIVISVPGAVNVPAPAPQPVPAPVPINVPAAGTIQAVPVATEIQPLAGPVTTIAASGGPIQAAPAMDPNIQGTAPSGPNAPKSEIQKQLEQLYQKDGRQMPSMNINDLPQQPPAGAVSAPGTISPPANGAPTNSAPAAAPPQQSHPTLLNRLFRAGKKQPAPSQPQVTAPAAPANPAPARTNPPQAYRPAPATVAPNPAYRPAPAYATPAPAAPAPAAPMQAAQMQAAPAQAAPAQVQSAPATRQALAPAVSPPATQVYRPAPPPSTTVYPPVSPGATAPARVQAQPLPRATAQTTSTRIQVVPAPRQLSPQGVPAQTLQSSKVARPIPTPVVQTLPVAAPSRGQQQQSDIPRLDADDASDDEDADEPATAAPMIQRSTPAESARQPGPQRVQQSPFSGLKLQAPDQSDLPIPKDVPAADETAPTRSETHPRTKEPELRSHSLTMSASPHTGFKGFCPVSVYYRKLIKAKPEFSSEYNSRVYQFATAEAKAEFDKFPNRFVPVAEGFDTVIAVEDDEKVEGSLDYAAWYLGRLYLFSCQANLTLFHSAPDDFCEDEVINVEKERLKSSDKEDEVDFGDDADDDAKPEAKGEPKPVEDATPPAAPQSDVKSGPGPVITPNPVKAAQPAIKAPLPKVRFGAPSPSPF